MEDNTGAQGLDRHHTKLVIVLQQTHSLGRQISLTEGQIFYEQLVILSSSNANVTLNLLLQLYLFLSNTALLSILHPTQLDTVGTVQAGVNQEPERRDVMGGGMTISFHLSW